MLTGDTELGQENVDAALTLVERSLFVRRIIPVTHVMQQSLNSTCCLLWCAEGTLPRARVGQHAWLVVVGKLEECNWKHEDCGVFPVKSMEV